MILLLLMALVLVVVLIGSMIGMMIDRKLLLKFFLCYELFSFILSVIMLGCSCEINVMIIVLFLLWNSTSEVVLGLSVLFTFNTQSSSIFSSIVMLFLLFMLWIESIFHFQLINFFTFIMNVGLIQWFMLTLFGLYTLDGLSCLWKRLIRFFIQSSLYASLLLFLIFILQWLFLLL